MRLQTWTITVSLVALGCVLAIPLHSGADDSKKAASAKPAASDRGITPAEIKLRQKSVEWRYKQFEEALQGLIADYAKKDPGKAELIRRAIGRSQELRIGGRIASVIKLLNSGEFGTAVEGQDEVLKRLQEMLTLLQSADRIDLLKAEQQRIKDLIKDLNKLISEQKVAQFEVERGRLDRAVLTKLQNEIAEKTKSLQEKIDRHDAARGAGKGQPKAGGSKDAPAGGPANPDKTPGRDKIKDAEKAMRRAIENLKKANREGTSQEQDKARNHLEGARAELEEILRQLREEERKLLLRALAARFKQMLKKQKMILNGTNVLNTIPHDRWKANQVARSKELSADEGKLAIEADRALVLLKAEGSSIAFPDAVVEIREDMLAVARMLTKEDTGKDNQYIQRDIIDALQEMLEALRKESEPPAPGRNTPTKEGKPQDPDLVDKLAELKMLRSLQMRVNRRTRRLGNRFKGDTPTEKDAPTIRRLQELARRQARIQRSTYELAKKMLQAGRSNRID